MLKYSLATLVLVALVGLLPACGGAELGEACATRGSQEECVDGAVCEQETSSAAEPTCLKVCKDAAECASTEDCNGVSGTNVKACVQKTK